MSPWCFIYLRLILLVQLFLPFDKEGTCAHYSTCLVSTFTLSFCISLGRGKITDLQTVFKSIATSVGSCECLALIKKKKKKQTYKDRILECLPNSADHTKIIGIYEHPALRLLSSL